MEEKQPMDASQQISTFKELLESQYHAELLERIRKGQSWIEIVIIIKK